VDIDDASSVIVTGRVARPTRVVGSVRGHQASYRQLQVAIRFRCNMDSAFLLRQSTRVSTVALKIISHTHKQRLHYVIL